ncbi:MAG: hypothetical protein AAGI38_05495 [Bacteroidota bacterium]
MKFVSYVFVLLILAGCVKEKGQEASIQPLVPMSHNSRGVSDPSTQPEEVIDQGDIEAYLKKHRISGEQAQKIRKSLNEKNRISTVRAVTYATGRSLPESKAITDTLFFLAHGEPLSR